AEYVSPGKEKPNVAWTLELQKGGTFRLTESAPNLPDEFGKKTEKLESGRWWIIEPSVIEKAKSIIWKTEIQVGLEFAPTQDDVRRGQVRKSFGKVVEKNERYGGRTTLHLASEEAITRNRVDAPASFNFSRMEPPSPCCP